MDSNPPPRIAVLGPGLIGGSLLLALRKRAPASELSAWVRRAEAACELNRLDPAIRAGTDLAAAVAGAGLLVLCTPVSTMPDIARQLASMPLDPGCVVTDAGSVKTPVVTALEAAFARSNAAFVGGHPMAGSERGGIEAASADLFQGAVCILTPTLFTTAAALDAARRLWTVAGCRILEMPAEEHDRKIARVSHLPHLAAAAVALAALRPDPGAAECAGNGLRDATRLAAGDPALWAGILSRNRAEIATAIEDTQVILGTFLAAVRMGDEKALATLLGEARSLRAAVRRG